MSTTFKRIVFPLLAMAGGVWAVLESGASPAHEPAPDFRPADVEPTTEIFFPVRVAVARRGPLLREVKVGGTLRPLRSFPIAFRVSGELIRHSLWNGHRVNAEEELAALDDRAYRREYELASAQLLAAQIEYRSLSRSAVPIGGDAGQPAAALQEAAERLQDLEKTRQSGGLPASSLQRLEREVMSQIAYLTADRGDIIALKCGLVAAVEHEGRAAINLASCVLRAPFTGLLANCSAEPGMLVQTGKELGVLIDDSQLLLDADVLESEIRYVDRGDSAVVEVPAEDGTAYPGTVRFVNPLHEAATRSALVTIAVSSRSASHGGRRITARPGMFATARIIADRVADRILVPRDALLFRSNRPTVFIVRGGRSHWAYVKVGEQSESLVALTEGVTAGDTVVVDGHFALGHDAKVRIEHDGGEQ